MDNTTAERIRDLCARWESLGMSLASHQPKDEHRETRLEIIRELVRLQAAIFALKLITPMNHEQNRYWRQQLIACLQATGNTGQAALVSRVMNDPFPVFGIALLRASLTEDPVDRSVKINTAREELVVSCYARLTADYSIEEVRDAVHAWARLWSVSQDPEDLRISRQHIWSLLPPEDRVICHIIIAQITRSSVDVLAAFSAADAISPLATKLENVALIIRTVVRVFQRPHGEDPAKPQRLIKDIDPELEKILREIGPDWKAALELALS